MKTELQPFNLGALMYVVCNLRPEEFEQARLTGLTDLDAVILAFGSAAGPKWIFQTQDGTPLVAGGFIPTLPGSYRTWFLATADAWASHGRAITVMAAERLGFMLENGARRLETLCLASRKDAHKWYETIGLVHEATLRSYYSDGSDAVLYVKVKG
ncbi:MAG: hypothetical protein KGL39_14765 [Patescibacteria group bacterium]|nr:hypothetical protein [Patescibacteria group bacterium]